MIGMSHSEHASKVGTMLNTISRTDPNPVRWTRGLVTGEVASVVWASRVHQVRARLSILGWMLFGVATLTDISPPQAQTELREEHVEAMVVRNVLPKRTNIDLRALRGFIENAGQWDSTVRFVVPRANGTVIARCGALDLVFTGRDESTGSVHQEMIRLELSHPEGQLSPVAGQALPGYFNYLLGDDAALHRSFVPHYEDIVYATPSGRVRVRFDRGEEGEVLRYTVHSGSRQELEALRFRYLGGTSSALESSGAYQVRATYGTLRQSNPLAFRECQQAIDQAIKSSVVEDCEGGFRFQIDQAVGAEPLLVDPGLIWSTFLGGVADDVPWACEVLDTGETLLAGFTESVGFPVTPGAIDVNGDVAGDGYVTKFDSTGSNLVFSTFLGGLGENKLDVIAGMHVEPSGKIALCGYTTSTSFPTTSGAFDSIFSSSHPSFSDGFVSRLRADGSALLASTYLGGALQDFIFDITEDALGNLIVVGRTSSPDFPTTPGTIQPNYAAPGGDVYHDGLVAILSPDGKQLLRGTFLGGTYWDTHNQVLEEASGHIVVAGHSSSPDFPTTPGAFMTVFTGQATSASPNATVSRLSPDLATIHASTYLGGMVAPIGNTYARSLLLTANDELLISGVTYSFEFPTTPDALQPGPKLTPSGTGFVSLFSGDLSTLNYSTYLGGLNTIEELQQAREGPDGTIWAVGLSYSALWPTTTGALDTTPTLFDQEAVFAVLTADGNTLLYSTYVGTQASGDRFHALDIGPDLTATLVGTTQSQGYPTTPGAFDLTYGGCSGCWGDTVVTRIDPLPMGVQRYGSPTPLCGRPMHVYTTGQPVAGDAGFHLVCAGAPSGAVGALALSGAAMPGGLPLLGVISWIDPAILFQVKPVIASQRGTGKVAVPIPATAGGIQAFAQFVWIGTAACGGVSVLGSSDALSLSIP
jgi:hypothetical protein